MSEHLRVAIIGAGFAGIGMAIKLQQANAGPYLVFERAAGSGAPGEKPLPRLLL